MSRTGKRIRTGLTVLAVGAMAAACVNHWATTEPVAVPATSGSSPAQSRQRASESAATTTTTTACDAKIASLSTRERLAQLLVVGVDGSASTQAMSAVLDEQAGGIFLAGRATALLTDGALTEVKSSAKLPLTVAVDDEGGRVQRVAALDGDIPSARRMAATMTPDQVRTLAQERGRALQARGVTMDLAPVLDISSQPDEAVIGDRSFSTDPATVRRYAASFAAGLHDAGVLPVLKHFPGHGNATGDTHLGLASTPPLEQLWRNDLLPYRDSGQYGETAVMVGHLDVPGLTNGAPATLSPHAYALLHEDIGFSGPAITDDLGAMKAVTERADLPDAVLQALSAGADMALWSSGGRIGEVLDRLEQALTSGALTSARADEALHRVLAMKRVC
jgi:beta-N-acetylhexosaminidase